MILSSPFFQAYGNSDVFGKLIFIFLFLLSIISWVILIEKIRFAKNGENNCKILKKIFEKRKDNILSFPIEKFSKNFNPYYSIYFSLKEKTLEILSKNKKIKNQVYLSKGDINLIQAQIEDAIEEQSKYLEKNLFVLSTVITLAPFLGLLGTVWGILTTFSHLHMGFSGVNSAVLFGISMALATTVLGLIVAIPALIAYNYLKNRIKNFISDMYLFSSKLMVNLEMQYRKVEKE